MAPPKTPEESEAVPPSSTLLKKLESATIDTASKLLNMPKKPKTARVTRLTPEQEEQLRKIESEAIADFQGDLCQLEAALGMLRMGHHYGWKVLYIIHSKKTIRNYEDILKIRIRDVFDETGPSSYRSIGFHIAQMYSNFWKVAGGDIKIPRRKDAAS